MAKTYIVAPNFAMGADILRLGDILVNPLSADLDPLNFDCRHPIDPTNIKEPNIVASFESSRKALLSGRFGLWTTFLAALGIPIGVDLGLFLERNSDDVIKAEKLVTNEFRATDDYVKEVIEKPDVKHYLQGRKYRVPVYMVTGIKVAKGASINREASTEVDAKAGASSHGNKVAKVKPLIQFVKKRSEGISFESKTDFVLAFRVRRITFVHEEPKHKLSQDGTSMMDRGGQTSRLPDFQLEGDFSREEAEEHAENEEVQVLVEEEGDMGWVVTDGDNS